MKPHVVEIDWERNGSKFTDHRYSRAHVWRFDGGAKVPGSSSPDVVRVPLSDPSAVDPEEAFVASLSSCHMLWFLDLVARDGYVVDKYADRAEGYLAKRSDGKLWLSRIVLAPSVTFSGKLVPTTEAVDDLHHRAHEECFLANAVKAEIVVQGTWTYDVLEYDGNR
ncbi:OsmC family protein [Polaromonas sp.]|uniref:OsmC family protein n=1 Tax=Polaromonas sp. TaxID=1869339 RepID=UPI002FC60A2D